MQILKRLSDGKGRSLARCQQFLTKDQNNPVQVIMIGKLTHNLKMELIKLLQPYFVVYPDIPVILVYHDKTKRHVREFISGDERRFYQTMMALPVLNSIRFDEHDYDTSSDRSENSLKTDLEMILQMTRQRRVQWFFIETSHSFPYHALYQFFDQERVNQDLDRVLVWDWQKNISGTTFWSEGLLSIRLPYIRNDSGFTLENTIEQWNFFLPYRYHFDILTETGTTRLEYPFILDLNNENPTVSEKQRIEECSDPELSQVKLLEYENLCLKKSSNLSGLIQLKKKIHQMITIEHKNNKNIVSYLQFLYTQIKYSLQDLLVANKEKMVVSCGYDLNWKLLQIASKSRTDYQGSEELIDLPSFFRKTQMYLKSDEVEERLINLICDPSDELLNSLDFWKNPDEEWTTDWLHDFEKGGSVGLVLDLQAMLNYNSAYFDSTIVDLSPNYLTTMVDTLPLPVTQMFVPLYLNRFQWRHSRQLLKIFLGLNFEDDPTSTRTRHYQMLESSFLSWNLENEAGRWAETLAMIRTLAELAFEKKFQRGIRKKLNQIMKPEFRTRLQYGQLTSYLTQALVTGAVLSPEQEKKIPELLFRSILNQYPHKTLEQNFGPEPRNKQPKDFYRKVFHDPEATVRRVLRLNQQLTMMWRVFGSYSGFIREYEKGFGYFGEIRKKQIMEIFAAPIETIDPKPGFQTALNGFIRDHHLDQMNRTL